MKIHFDNSPAPFSRLLPLRRWEVQSIIITESTASKKIANVVISNIRKESAQRNTLCDYFSSINLRAERSRSRTGQVESRKDAVP